MKILYRSLHSKSQIDMFQIYELKRRGVISEEICEVFENAERLHSKRKPQENILKWWLGWSNHRQLLKVLRETRLDLRKSQVTPAEMKDDKVEDAQVPNPTADDHSFEEELYYAVEQLAIDDVSDGDYLDFADGDLLEDDDVVDIIEDVHDADGLVEEEFDLEVWPEDFDEVPLPLDAAENDAEQTLIDFAKNQMERMKLIRDQKLDVPNEIVRVSADQILKLPLGQRWMLFAHWMHSYQELIQQDMRETEKEYKEQIVEFNKLKGQAMAALCRTANIVGMTTTGAAKNRLMLESLKPKIGKEMYFSLLQHGSHYSLFM